jgi:hypothetical protein
MVRQFSRHACMILVRPGRGAKPPKPVPAAFDLLPAVFQAIAVQPRPSHASLKTRRSNDQKTAPKRTGSIISYPDSRGTTDILPRERPRETPIPIQPRHSDARGDVVRRHDGDEHHAARQLSLVSTSVAGALAGDIAVGVLLVVVFTWVSGFLLRRAGTFLSRKTLLDRVCLQLPSDAVRAALEAHPDKMPKEIAEIVKAESRDVNSQLVSTAEESEGTSSTAWGSESGQGGGRGSGGTGGLSAWTVPHFNGGSLHGDAGEQFHLRHQAVQVARDQDWIIHLPTTRLGFPEVFQRRFGIDPGGRIGGRSRHLAEQIETS